MISEKSQTNLKPKQIERFKKKDNLTVIFHYIFSVTMNPQHRTFYANSLVEHVNPVAGTSENRMYHG